MRNAVLVHIAFVLLYHNSAQSTATISSIFGLLLGRLQLEIDSFERVYLCRDLTHYKGDPDPFKGDTPNQKVRDAAKEAVEAIFAPTETPSYSTANSSSLQVWPPLLFHVILQYNSLSSSYSLTSEATSRTLSML